MDLLADIFQQAGLRRRLLHQRALEREALLRFPCEKSIGFHIVLQGQAYIHVASERGKGRGKPPAPIRLEKGDVAWMARGCEHLVSAHESVNRKQIRELGSASTPRAQARLEHSLLVSGAYQFWNSPVHPLFSELPEWFVIRSSELASLERLPLAIGLLEQEIARPELGSESVVNGLLDVIFHYLVRRIVELNGSKPKSWSHALKDPQIRKAVELLHAEPSKEWTLEMLARQVGLSRAGLAQKFKASMGDTPLHYLTTIRMQKAMEMLTQSELNLGAVASAVGYKDAFGFSKVFKKTVGVSPRDFRRSAAENAEYRFSNPA
jgi:AraC-like DNA-binding protein